MLDYYHIARTPGGYHVHRIDPVMVLERAAVVLVEDPELTEPEAVAEVHADIVDAIRLQLGFPGKGRWVARDGWDSSLTVGQPHPHLLAVATVHDDLPGEFATSAKA